MKLGQRNRVQAHVVNGGELPFDQRLERPSRHFFHEKEAEMADVTVWLGNVDADRRLERKAAIPQPAHTVEGALPGERVLVHLANHRPGGMRVEVHVISQQPPFEVLDGDRPGDRP